MNASKLINWGELSRLLSGSRMTIRKNNIPKCHQPIISELLEGIEKTMSKVNATIQQVKKLTIPPISNHVKIATLKHENHGYDCLTFGKEYQIELKDNYSGGRIHIRNDNNDYRIYKINNFNCY